MRARSRDPPRAVTSFVAWRCKHSRLSFIRERYFPFLSRLKERKIEKTDNPNEGCEEDRVPTCTSGACFRPACVLFEWFFGCFPRIYKVTKQHVPRTRLARVSRSETEKTFAALCSQAAGPVGTWRPHRFSKLRRRPPGSASVPVGTEQAPVELLRYAGGLHKRQ